MKFAVFTVMLPELNVVQAVDALAKHGYDGVEWRVTAVNPAKQGEVPSFWGNNLCTVDITSTDDQLQEIRKLTEQAGLEIPNLACYLSAGDLEGTERGMYIAQQLGAPSIRIPVPMYDRNRHYLALYEETRTYLEKVQSLSRRSGIKGVIEIHMGNIATSASLAHRLVEGFDPNHIGIIYDPGNMVYEGYEQYRMGLELIGPYLAHVHVKNAGWVQEPIQENQVWKTEAVAMPAGIADWKQIIDDLRSVSYDGWLSFEDFSRTGTTDELLKRNIDFINSLL